MKVEAQSKTIGRMSMTTVKHWRSLVLGSMLLMPAMSCSNMPDDQGLTSESFLSTCFDSLPNNFPIVNGSGYAAAFSTAGAIDFTNEFNTPQGTNGRSCATCHIFTSGWGNRPIDDHILFALTQGTH